VVAVVAQVMMQQLVLVALAAQVSSLSVTSAHSAEQAALSVQAAAIPSIHLYLAAHIMHNGKNNAN